MGAKLLIKNKNAAAQIIKHPLLIKLVEKQTHELCILAIQNARPMELIIIVKSIKNHSRKISEEILKAYMDRFQKMQANKDTEEGNTLFISKVVAESEQIDNMHVMAKVGNFEIENDGPKDLGGYGKVPGPMQMLLATLANCLEITALLYLTFSNVRVNSIKVKVEGTHDKRSALEPKKEPFPGFYDINYTWYIDTEEKPEKVEQILKKVEEGCPVKGSLNNTPNFHSKVEYIN